MNTLKKYVWVVLATALLATGCSRMSGRSDAQVATDVQGKINSDANVPDKQISINANQGVVTLSGTVSSDAARTAAAGDAAQIAGVKTVVNNLTVAAPEASNPASAGQSVADDQPAPAPERRKASPARSHRRASADRAPAQTASNDNSGDNGLRTTVPANDTPAASTADNTPPRPLPPQPVTIPSGTQIAIRVSEQLSSETSQVGDVFHGSISAPISVDGQPVVPTTADVEGRVVEVKPAARFKGQSDLQLELTRLVVSGKSYTIQTDRWSKAGNARGKSTAAKVGGGAAVGAILGGIFGGGKGAAIGAAAGAGAGTGVAGATKGEAVVVKPESILNFQLQNSVNVTPGSSTRQAMNN